MTTWTQAEVDFIENNPELSYLGVAEALGRTRGSVRRKVERMRNPELKGTKPGARPGEAHHKAKLTEALVREIRQRYAAGGISMFSLWEEYQDVVDVGLGTFTGALTRRTWKHI